MEEETDQTSSQEENLQTPKVGFPAVKKKSELPKYLISLIVIIVLGAGGWFLFTKPEEEKLATPTPTPVSVEEPTPTPQEKVEREGIKIQVLNGTGIDKAASSLKEILTDFGYENVGVGNASNKDNKITQVIFAESVPTPVKNEIENKLKDLYDKVETKVGGLKNFDVQIITGYPKGHTPTPTVTKAPTNAPTPVATSSATVTPTKTPTPTP